jgi:hypothetical protein
MGTLLLGGCAGGSVTNVSQLSAQPQRRPDTVYVYDFAIRPDQVKLDTSGIAQKLKSLGGTSADAEQAQAAAEVQDALANDIVQKLQKMGLRAVRASVPPPADQNALIVQGSFDNADEGNRRRRIVIGLGAGKSELGASVQLLYQPAYGAPQFVRRFDADSDSGHMPGMAETAGVGAAAGHVATSAAMGAGLKGVSEKKRGSLAANAGNLADSIAKQVGDLGVSQGWMPAGRTD